MDVEEVADRLGVAAGRRLLAAVDRVRGTHDQRTRGLAEDLRRNQRCIVRNDAACIDNAHQLACPFCFAIQTVAGNSGLVANNGDYVFTQAPSNATALTIDPATLTVAADPESKIYGTPDPTLTFASSGFVNGDTAAILTGAQTRAAGETVDSGPYAISQGTLSAGGNYTMPGPLENIGDDGWRLSIDGNLTATFLSLKSFLPGMKERRRGSIVTISSAAARRPHPGTPIPYAAAKAGIIIMTQHLATQVGPFNIRVNCITPETILT